MNPTSHFVWAKLRSEILVDLYVRLQKTLWDDFNAIEFQNILSSHVTFFYFPESISSFNLEKISKIINSIDLSQFQGKLTGFSYFWKLESPRLCYLLPDNIKQLSKLNLLFRSKFSEYLDIPDNKYEQYIPHITIFRVLNSSEFSEKRKKLESALMEQISKMNNEDLFESISLFKVNSYFNPQIQIEVPIV